jgi:hypothetical protein
VHLPIWPRHVAAFRFVPTLVLVPALLLAACDAGERPAARTAETATPALTDSAAAARVALDTLARLGMKDFIVDSLVASGDTVVVWAGPRNWMATDRPTSAVTVVRPARVVAVRHVYGG